MTEDLNRIRKLAGVPLMEAEQHTWTPSAQELAAEQEAELDRRDDAAADQYDLEDKSEKNILYALEKVGIEAKRNSIYFVTEEIVEMKVYYDADGLPFSQLMALAQSGIGSDFSVMSSDSMLTIRFTVDPNLSASSIAE